MSLDSKNIFFVFSFFLKAAGLTDSTSSANRLIQQGGVRLNQEKISDNLLFKEKKSFILQAGKRHFAKIRLY